jgi:hypothetical protein
MLCLCHVSMVDANDCASGARMLCLCEGPRTAGRECEECVCVCKMQLLL